MQRLVQTEKPSRGMDLKTRETIRQMRTNGMGYQRISDALNISRNTIKSYCQRHGLGGLKAFDGEPSTTVCKFCGKEVKQNPGRKRKLYCDDVCRMSYWKKNKDKINHKAVYEFECPQCQKRFTSYGNPNRKYCSRLCLMTARFGYREYWEGRARIVLDAQNKAD